MGRDLLQMSALTPISTLCPETFNPRGRLRDHLLAVAKVPSRLLALYAERIKLAHNGASLAMAGDAFLIQRAPLGDVAIHTVDAGEISPESLALRFGAADYPLWFQRNGCGGNSRRALWGSGRFHRGLYASKALARLGAAFRKVPVLAWDACEVVRKAARFGGGSRNDFGHKMLTQNVAS
jgi:hypothetical protein